MKINPNPSDLQALTNAFNSSNTASKVLTTSIAKQSVLPQYSHPQTSADEFKNYFDQQFFKYLPGQTEELRAQNQGSLEQLGRSTLKFVGKTGANVAGGIGGTVYGGLNALYNWDFEKMYDNNVINTIESFKEQLDKNFPIYKTKEFEQSGFLKRLFQHPAQLSDDISDAGAFTAGAIITGLITQGVSNAMLSSSAIRAFNMLDKAAKAGKVLKGMEGVARLKGAYDIYKLSSQLFFGANFEAIVETKQSMEELRKALELRGLSESQIEDTIESAEKFSYFSNMAVVGLSNMGQFPKVFNPFYGKSLLKLSSIGIDDAGKAFAKYAKQGKLMKGLSTTGTILKHPFQEGIFEEGLQKVISETSQDYWTRLHDPEAQETIQSFLSSFVDNAIKTYDPNNKEAWNEIGLGMLIGGIGAPGRGAIPGDFGKVDGKRAPIWQGGIYGAFQERKVERQTTDDLVTELNQNPNVLPVIKAQYEALIRDASIQKDMDRALELDDKFAWKNLQHDQVFNWIRSRIKAGLTDVAKDQIEKLREMSPEEFSKQMYGEKPELQITAEQQTKLIDHLVQKVDYIAKATNKTDQVYRSDQENKEKDVNRETIIYAMSALEDLDSRESEMYKEIAALTKGLITEDMLRAADPSSYKETLERKKKELSDSKLSEQEKEELKKAINFVEGKIKEGSLSDKINYTELKAMDQWMSSDATGYTINRKEVIQMLEDAKKIRKRRHGLIHLYNSLFVKEGKQKLAAQIEQATQAQQAQVVPNKTEAVAQFLKDNPNKTFLYKDQQGTLSIVNGKVVFTTLDKKRKITLTDEEIDNLQYIEDQSDTETKEEINARLKAFSVVLEENYNRFFELNEDVKRLDTLIEETHTKARATAQKLKFQKSSGLSEQLIQETEDLLEHYRHQLNSYQQLRDTFKEQMDSLEQNIEFIENFIKEMSSKKTVQEFRTPVEQAVDILKQAKKSTDQLKQGINSTKDLIDSISTKIKQLKDYIKQLEKTLAEHKDWQFLLQDIIQHNKAFLGSINITETGFKYDHKGLAKYLEWRMSTGTAPWNTQEHFSKLKMLQVVMQDTYDAVLLSREIQATIDALESQDFEGTGIRSSIPMNQYLLETLESQLANQQQRLQEQEAQLALQEQAERIFNLYSNALPVLQKLTTPKNKPPKPSDEDPQTPKESPLDVRTIQSDPRKVDHFSTGNLAFELTDKKEVKLDENGQPVVKSHKVGSKEHRWALFLDKLESFKDYTVKLVRDESTLDTEQKAIENLYTELITNPKIKKENGLIVSNSDNLALIQEFTSYKNYTTPGGFEAPYPIKDIDYHINEVNKRLQLLQILNDYSEQSKLNIVKGVSLVVYKDDKPVYLDIDGNPAESGELATSMIMSPSSVLIFDVKDNKPVNYRSTLVIPKEVKTDAEKLAYLKPKVQELIKLRNQVLENSSIDAEILDVSEGIPLEHEPRPLTEAQKQGELTVATKDITVLNGKRYKTPGNLYILGDKALEVKAFTHNDEKRVTNIIDLISYLYKQRNSTKNKLTEITIKDQNNKPIYLLNFDTTGNKQGLISDLLFWGPHESASNTIHIDIKTQELVLKYKSNEPETRVPLKDLDNPNSPNYQTVKAFLTNKYFNISKSRLEDKNEDFLPDFTIQKDPNLNNWKVIGTPVNYHKWIKSNAVGTNRFEAKGQQFSAVSHYLSFTNPKINQSSISTELTTGSVNTPHFSEQDSEIDKNKRGYTKIRVASKNDKLEVGFRYVYAKSITIPGFEDYHFSVYNNSESGSNYVIVETSKGRAIPFIDHTSIKAATKGAKETLEKYKDQLDAQLEKYETLNIIKSTKKESKPETSDLEAKKADIERRRQEELNKGSLPNVPDYVKEEIDRNVRANRNLLQKVIELAYNNKTKAEIAKELNIDKEIVNSLRAYLQIPSMDSKTEFNEWKNKIDSINAKYDAELAALEGKKEETKSTVKPKSSTQKSVTNNKDITLTYELKNGNTWIVTKNNTESVELEAKSEKSIKNKVMTILNKYNMALADKKSLPFSQFIKECNL